ncbi:MAG: UV DNA damage repair endonuclease UvsE [Candidatus Eremiobacteraeota bacterium]|nr:UV DNA damage repair endonuclease UvsE [Candidatus Eremiobacteraeota bacterium]
MPILGLVCQTTSQEVRYRTITRTRLLSLPDDRRDETLGELYRDNARRLQAALEYCEAHIIGMYRMPTGLFPFMDHPLGAPLMHEPKLRKALKRAGDFARSKNIRLVSHPDQFVVLNSERPEVVENSVRVLTAQAKLFDLLELPLTPWAAITLHGGKRDRGQQLIDCIRMLPFEIRDRMVLENDERAYGAEDILRICRTAGVPMVFDAHHHLVKERLASYDDESVVRYTAEAAQTWNPVGTQIVHISNGATSLHDARHSDTIAKIPGAFSTVPYIEVEAKAKEQALFALRTMTGFA